MNRRFRRKLRVGIHASAEERAKAIKIIAISLVALAVVILLAVLWGNALKNKADNAGDDTGGDQTGEQTGQGTPLPGIYDVLPASSYDPAKVPVIKAEYIILSSSKAINWSAQVSALSAAGKSAVSLILYYTENGKSVINYSSKTAQSMGYQEPGTSKTNLYEAVGALDIGGIYTSGCFYVNYTAQSTSELRGIYRAYEAALIAEAAGAGLSDILLFGFGTGEAEAIEASKLIAAVYEIEAKATIGVALPREVANMADIDEIFSNFASVSKFLAVDMSDITDEGVLSETLERLSYFIKIYNLRIVIHESLLSVIGEFDGVEIKNWQAVP